MPGMMVLTHRSEHRAGKERRVAATDANPTLARRELAVYFAQLREQRERSLEDLASILGVTLSQASRLDTGARGFRIADVEKLAAWYDLGAAELLRLRAIAENARKRAWWQQVDLPDSYRTLIGLEQGAELINEYSATVIPGLLQTRDYASAAVRITAIGIQPEAVAQAVDVRIRRQEILDRHAPPALSVVIDEVALARGAGGPEVMKAQLHHLLKLRERPNVSIQVIGFEAGLYPGGPFILVQLPRGIPDVHYSETQHTQRDTTDADTLRRVRRHWQALQAIAMSPEQSAARIAKHRNKLT
jgi:transcriptional regulator with XRE-family HTH domain